MDSFSTTGIISDEERDDITEAICLDLIAAIMAPAFRTFEDSDRHRLAKRLDLSACAHCKTHHPDKVGNVLHRLGEGYLSIVARRPVQLLVSHPTTISL
jgi:hypothetical protein